MLILIKDFIIKIITIGLQILELQLFLTAISLPILISWGLPVSIAFWCSTPLFAPYFSLFLFLSSCIFFTQLLGIPNWPLIWLLERISYWWIRLLQWGTPHWLIGFKKVHPFLLSIIPIGAFFIISTPYIKSTGKRILYLTILLLISGGLLKLSGLIQSVQCISIVCEGSSFNLIYDCNKTILIDSGDLAKKPINQSWIEYTLMPEITKKTGKTYLTELICLQFNQRTIESIKIFNKVSCLKAIYLPYYNGRIEASAFKMYMQLIKELKKSETKIISLGVNNDPVRIDFDNQNSILITCSTMSIAYHDANYLPLEVNGSIHGQTIRIGAHKLNNLKRKEYDGSKSCNIGGRL